MLLRRTTKTAMCNLIVLTQISSIGLGSAFVSPIVPLSKQVPTRPGFEFLSASTCCERHHNLFVSTHGSRTPKPLVVRMNSADERLPSLPAMVGPIGGLPLLPGSSQVITSPSPGQYDAMKTALAFAAVDDRLGGKPVLAYFSSSTFDESMKGTATIASIEEVSMAEDGTIYSARITGVGRAIIPRVRNVEGTSFLVADKWARLNDVPPAASYMHALEVDQPNPEGAPYLALTSATQMMRPLENDATYEHNERRRQLAKLTSTSVDLQLCDLDGVCSTEMLLELGPDVYSKAQELIAMAAGAAASPDRQARVPMSGALTPLADLARKGAGRVGFWEGQWPQFGDEVDGEMQYLRCFSFACWQALYGVVSSEEYAWAIACTDTMERTARAAERMAEHRQEVAQAQAVLDTLKRFVR